MNGSTPSSSSVRRSGILVCALGALVSVSVARAAEPSALRVCAHANAGFFTRDASGAPSGLEFDLLTGFAASAKVTLDFQDSPSFDALLKDTEAGRCQIGASTVTVNEERKSRFQFSAPYFPNRVVVVQKTSSGFAQPSDLKGHRVAVVKGTLSTRMVEEIAGVKSVLVADDAAAFDALLKGEADALACDSAVVLHFLTRHLELGMAFPIGQRAFFAFVLPKDSKLVPALNAYLRSLVGTGEFTKMLSKHFGESNASFLASEIASAGSRP